MINVSHLVIFSISITHIRKHIHNLRFDILVKPWPTRSLVREKLDCAQVIVIVLVKSRRWLMLTKHLFFRLSCKLPSIYSRLLGALPWVTPPPPRIVLDSSWQTWDFSRHSADSENFTWYKYIPLCHYTSFITLLHPRFPRPPR